MPVEGNAAPQRVPELEPLEPRVLLSTVSVESLATGTLYFSEDNNSNGLYTFDASTGAATHVGTSGVTSANVGLAPSADADLLYGSKYATLLHINADGSGSVDVGGIGNEGLAYDPTTGTIYGAINGSFRTINPADGTVLVNLTGPGADVEGVAYANGYVYGLVSQFGGGTPGELLRYDIGADSWSPVGDTGLGNIDSVGLAADPYSNVLYAKVVNDTMLYAIDPATAGVSVIGDTGINAGGGLAYVPLGRIEGNKWMDEDGDGDRDPGEPGLAAWRIYLDDNHNGAWDPGELYDLTDASGDYAIEDVPPGTYALAEEPQGGWVQTFPHVAGAGTLYFSKDNDSNGLYTFDTATGAATHVGTSGVTSNTVGLAPSGSPDLLYGSKPYGLLHIDADGSGSLGVGGVGNEGLAYDSTTGTIYGALNGDFRTINPADGTVLVNLTNPGADVEGLAYANGYIYGLVCVGGGGGTPGELLRYDIGADSWSLVGDTGLGNIDYGGLAADQVNNVLYAKVIDDTMLYAIDPATAGVSVIGDTGENAGGGLAFVDVGGARIGIDGFEDGDIAEYVEYSGSSTKSVSAAAARDGVNGLLFQSGAWIAREDSAAQVAQGDVVSVWIRLGGAASGRAYFGFGASAGGTLSAVLAPNTNELMIQDNTGYGYVDLAGVAQTYAADTWYRLEVDWGTGGTIVATLYASDGITPINSVSATTSAITSGGIAFRGIVGDKHFDTVTRLGAGALVGVDFDQPGGALPANWTQFTGGAGTTLADLMDENGDTTLFDLAISTSGVSIGTFHSSPDPLTLPQHSQPLGGLDGYIIENGATWTFEWTDLTPQARYEVYVFGLRTFSGGNEVTITANGLPRNFSQTLVPDELVVNDEFGDSGRELASFAEILWADDAGRIVIEVSPGLGATAPALGGMAIRQVSPGPRTYLIEVESGQVHDGYDFGNYPLPGEIRGRKSYDMGADGVLDPGDPGLEGWRIYVDANASGSWDPGEPYDLTDADGNYAIQNAPVGTQTVSEEPPESGWSQTFPMAYAAHAVPFGFESIHVTGMATMVGADDQSVALSPAMLAGFEFSLYGTTYSSVYFSSNGLITFGSGVTSWSNSDMTSTPSMATIAPFWDDLVISGAPSSAVYWEVRGAGDAQRLIIQWHEVSFFGAVGLGTVTFQAVLSEVGDAIRFSYLDLDSASPHAGGASATAGIKDAGDQGPDRLVVCYNDGPNAYVGTGQSTWIGRSGSRPHSVEVGPAGFSNDVDFGNVLLGDTNGDGVVDGTDYTLWADHYKQVGGWWDGDSSENGFVDGGDYTLWADNFERSVGASAASAGAMPAGSADGQEDILGRAGDNSAGGMAPAGWAPAYLPTGSPAGRNLPTIARASATIPPPPADNSVAYRATPVGRTRLRRNLPALDDEIDLLAGPDLSALALSV